MRLVGRRVVLLPARPEDADALVQGFADDPTLPVRWRHPRPGDLARVGVDPLRGDLRPMLIRVGLATSRGKTREIRNGRGGVSRGRSW